MMDIMFDQKFREIIPAGLPEGVRVAHKTGSISGVRHDAGIVLASTESASVRYVLVLLSKEMPEPETGVKAMAEVSRLVYQHATAKTKR
jgi:beta-lactamase class A